MFRSKGEAKAMFLRHEGFLGALGAFVSYDDKQGLSDIMTHQLVEKFPLGTGDRITNPVLGEFNDNGNVECSILAV